MLFAIIAVHFLYSPSLFITHGQINLSSIDLSRWLISDHPRKDKFHILGDNNLVRKKVIRANLRDKRAQPQRQKPQAQHHLLMHHRRAIRLQLSSNGLLAGMAWLIDVATNSIISSVAARLAVLLQQQLRRKGKTTLVARSFCCCACLNSFVSFQIFAHNRLELFLRWWSSCKVSLAHSAIFAFLPLPPFDLATFISFHIGFAKSLLSTRQRLDSVISYSATVCLSMPVCVLDVQCTLIFCGLMLWSVVAVPFLVCSWIEFHCVCCGPFILLIYNPPIVVDTFSSLKTSSFSVVSFQLTNLLRAPLHQRLFFFLPGRHAGHPSLSCTLPMISFFCVSASHAHCVFLSLFVCVRLHLSVVFSLNVFRHLWPFCLSFHSLIYFGSIWPFILGFEFFALKLLSFPFFINRMLNGRIAQDFVAIVNYLGRGSQSNNVNFVFSVAKLPFQIARFQGVVSARLTQMYVFVSPNEHQHGLNWVENDLVLFDGEPESFAESIRSGASIIIHRPMIGSDLDRRLRIFLTMVGRFQIVFNHIGLN